MIAIPFSSSNAIEASVFTLHLSRSADKEAEKRLDEALTARGYLPGREQAQSFSVIVGGSEPPAHLTRFEAQPNGTYAWSMHLQGPFLFVGCHQYTRFDQVWERARDLLLLGLEAIGETYAIATVTHQVVDRFVYNFSEAQQPREEYQMDEVLRRDTPYLTPKAWESGLLWHVHQGWFDQPRNGKPHLHQLHISNNELVPNLQYATIIDHRVTARPQDELSAFDKSRDSMDEIFRDLHTHNKLLMGELLSDAMQKIVGLRT